ncbi:FkbM family methyltransferase [Prochlorococcus marinus]|uniref:FkbM family methyltransferase n=1 Tax=Prochlorococcus marinus TaxID=1219 RepID=UPI0012DAD572|nr:FkbM family methyltransferase [Prochlorococcus marinus]
MPSDSPDRSLSPKLVEVDYPGYGKFLICATSSMIEWRATSFLEKEPTTIEWISSLESHAYLIDIGANIGIYTVPSALFNVKHVIAIEPELKNYTELIKNIEINQLTDKVTALPVAISTSLAGSHSHIFLTKDEPGMSCHQVGVNQDYKLNPINEERTKRSVYCISLESIINNFNIPDDAPLHIKIDVDGIEEDVCESLFIDKAIERVSSLQIELNPSITSHHALINKLHIHGFSFLQSQVNKAIRKEGSFKGFAEYVFRRRIAQNVYDSFPAHVKSRYTAVTADQSTDASAHLLGMPLNENLSPLIENVEVLSRQTPELVCNWPSVFILPKVFNVAESYSICNCVASSIPYSSKFTFESIHADKIGESLKVDESLRLGVSFGSVDVGIDSYKDLLKIKFAKPSASKLLLSRTCKAIKHYSNNNQEIFDKHVLKKYKYLLCRIRHFVDYQGFYINRHHDSPDTLFALVIPLRHGATATSLFSGIPLGLYGLSPGFNTLQKYLAKPREKCSFGSKAEWINVKDKSTALMGLVEKNRLKLSANSKFHCTELELRYGDGVCIPNMQCSLFKKTSFDSLEFALDTSGHGLYPPLRDLFRPVMLVDYLLVATNTYLPPEGSDEVCSIVCSLSDLLEGV